MKSICDIMRLKNDKKCPQKSWESILGDSPEQRKATLIELLPILLITWSNQKMTDLTKKKNRYTQRQMLGHLDANDFAHTLSRYELYHVSIWHLIPPYWKEDCISL